MRDLIITIIIFGSVPFILLRPHVGIMMWTWISRTVRGRCAGSAGAS